MNVLVVASHPDDEVLGVGGTIHRHVSAGHTVHVLIVSSGAASRVEVGNLDVSEEIAKLQHCAREAAQVLGVTSLYFLNFPDNRLDSIDLLDIVKQVEFAVEKTSARTVYTHWSGDLNIDHRRVNQSVLTACRPQARSSVEAVYAFETLSSSEWAFGQTGRDFSPRIFVDISESIEVKLAALRCYTSELREPPHPRSIEAVNSLARYRGGQSGFLAAEAFEVIYKRVGIELT